MWNGLVRRDGVHVISLDTTSKWVICAPNGVILHDGCPCCDLPMKSERIAKLVADGWIPLLPEAA